MKSYMKSQMKSHMKSRKHTANNNKDAVKLLARESRRHNRGRSLLLAGAVAFGMVVLCTVFSIVFGKMEAEYLQAARGSGTAASTYLERGTQEQYEAIAKLPYIEAVGRMITPGSAYLGETYICQLTVMDETGWNVMTVPAYTDIEGHYPQKKGELMLSVRGLAELGIKEPEIGMEITVTAEIGLFHKEEITFVLCGWYQDYVDPACYAPTGYLSEEQLSSWGLTLKKPDCLMIQQKNTMDGYSVEDRLYQDIKTIDDTQQFLGGNSYGYQIMNDFIGGYKMAAFCAVLMLLSVYLVIRNVLGISMQKDIRQIGLLSTVGTTARQVGGMYFRQILRLTVYGILAGVVLSAVIVLFIVPGILGNLYLYNFGRSSDLMVFRPVLFLAAAGFTAATVCTAGWLTIRKAVRFSPVEALHYTGSTVEGRKKRSRVKGTRRTDKSTDKSTGKSTDKSAGKSVEKKKGNRTPRQEVAYMALGNLLRTRKRFLVTVASLFLGIVVALGAVVISEGTDYTHSINRRPDFSVSGLGGGEMGSLNHFYDEFSPISEPVLKQLLAVKGILPDSVRLVQGGYMNVAFNSPALRPLVESENTIAEEDWADYIFTVSATIQTVDEAYMDQLETFVEENDLTVDMNSMREGNGVILLHEHQLSPTQMKKGDAVVGEEIEYARLPHQEEWEKRLALSAGELADYMYPEEEISTMEIAGYVDAGAKGFPNLRRGIHGPSILYFLVSEKGFEKLGTDLKTFAAEMDVEPKLEPAAKMAVEKILLEANREDPELGLYVNSKSSELEAAKGYLTTNKIIMGALSAVLILMGVLNYFNVMMTSMVSRQKEFAVLESIGMTGKQLKTMMLLEGAYYAALILVLVLTAGTGILKLIEWYMDRKIAYFKFIYPLPGILIVAAAVTTVCICVPLMVYRQMNRKSVVERMAVEAE